MSTISVASLSQQTQQIIHHRNLIVFDGDCVLCSRFFKFILRFDQNNSFHFATAHSEFGGTLYKELDLPPNEFETNIIIVDGLIYQKLDAFCAAMTEIGGGWRILAIAKFLPSRVKDFLYNSIARNRYKTFGRYDNCIIPEEAVKNRFIDPTPTPSISRMSIPPTQNLEPCLY